MKNRIKKILKYALMPLTMAIAFVSMLCVDTYAYNTNQFTNTLSSLQYQYQNIPLEQFEVSNTNTWSTLTPSEEFNYTYCCLLNVQFTSNFNLSYIRYNLNGSNNDYFSTYIYNGVNGQDRTILITLNNSGFYNTFHSTLNIRFDFTCIVKNIDIVEMNNLYLSYYYDTYISNLTNQLDTLQDNYDTLQNDYSTLEDNYDTLQDNYDTLQDNYDTLQDNYTSYQINVKTSIIKNNLDGTIVKSYNDNRAYNVAPSQDLSYYLGLTPNFTETITYNNTENVYYSMGQQTPQLLNYVDSGYNAPSRFTDNLYTFINPVQIDNLIFSRGDTTGTRYIILWFNDGTNTMLTMDEGEELTRKNVTWFNTENKLITHIMTDAQFGYNSVNNWSVQGSSVIYSNGYDNGFNSGYENGFTDGRRSGIQASQSEAYNRGLRDGASSDNSLYGLIIGICDAPINIFKQIFNFDILGINLVGVTFGIITLLIIIWLIKKII